MSGTTTLIYELSCSILLQKVNQKERRIHSISKKSPRGTVSTPPFIPPFFGGLAVDQRALGSTAPKYRCVANTLLYCTVLVRAWFLILYGDEARGGEIFDFDFVQILILISISPILTHDHSLIVGTPLSKKHLFHLSVTRVLRIRSGLLEVVPLQWNSISISDEVFNYSKCTFNTSCFFNVGNHVTCVSLEKTKHT